MQDEILSNEVGTVREITYHGDNVSTDERCEVAVIAKTRFQ